MTEDLVQRLRKRAEIRRQITTRKSVQNNEPDRIAELLEEAANRIGVLEANHKIQLDINEKALQYIAELEKGLESSLNLNKAQAERHGNNEPVAWMTAQGIQDVCTVNEKEEMGNDFDDYIIPLYTHPSEHDLGIAEAIGFDKGYKAATAKTLTDEEIEKVYRETHFSEAIGDCDFMEFARAILKKASEK